MDPPDGGDGTGPDAAIAAGLNARDPGALSALYDRYAGYALAVALRILRDRGEAEESVQDAFLQIWNGRVRYDPLRGQFRTWIFMIVRSRALDRLRRRAATPTATAARRSLGAAPRSAEEHQMQRNLLGLLERLNPEQRESLVLAFYEGLTHVEIAKQLAEPVGTIKSRIRRGLLELRAGLEAERVKP
jgi:RNA polymerase sigma-70 factor (ECF subfamily)